MTTYHVWREHTLLYRLEGAMFFSVLAGSVIEGGADPVNGPVSPVASELREATLEDFHAFRVCPKGHLA